MHSGLLSRIPGGLVALASVALAATSAPESADFFETRIRPVLVNSCFTCHATSQLGGLRVDSRDGILKGGKSGPAMVPGDPDKSLLIEAVRQTNPKLKMPMGGKRKDQEIQDLTAWVKAGANWPVTAASAAPVVNPKSGEYVITPEQRAFWSFQPLKMPAAPAPMDGSWAKTDIDRFVRAKLEHEGLKPVGAVDKRTLIRRATLDLTGLPPTFEEIEAFEKDQAPEAFAKVVDRLLASPQYGERWGRFWLDVARYGEDDPTSEATNPPYPFAWRYRDWVIDAINKDVPYDKFVKLQLAADLMPNTPRDDFRALGYLGAAPVYHTDLRLSKDVTETIFTDAWDERVDAVSRGVLGLTVSCARCHDHKFDPILTKDYYALAGMFASTTAAPRPLADLDKETEQKFMYTSQRLFYLSYMANLMNNEPGSKPEEAAKKSEQFTQEMVKARDSMAFLKESHLE